MNIKIPAHLAVIMDGNGRWAKSNNVSLTVAYNKGAESLHQLIESCLSIGIKYLTVFAFSTENWCRESEQIEILMNLVESYTKNKISYLIENNVCLKIIGERKNISSKIINLFTEAEKSTNQNNKLYLNVAFNYGARQEILRAFKLIMQDCKLNKIKIEEIDEEYFKNYLYTLNIPDPDLLIRTSGEMRLSNFLLWQLSYTELYFTETLWPDFGYDQLICSLSKILAKGTEDMEKMINKLADSNIMLRILTSLILAPIVIFITYLGGLYFKILILTCSVLMAYEWNNMTSKNNSGKYWNLLGVIYILLPCVSLIWLRERHNGKLLVFLLFSTVWVTDIAAFIFGRLIGGWKILPKISPNKTWSGLIGGAVCASFVGRFFAHHLGSEMPNTLTSFCVVLAIYAQIGDFIESWIKRKFNSKDSGNILPGHGGILDRVDGLVATAPKLAIAVILDKWGIFS